MTRPTIYEHRGGAPALDAFVEALHVRCLADPVLEHPFSHGLHPDHLANLAAYLAEVLGGPSEYSSTLGGQSGMLDVHAGTGADDAFSAAFAACVMAAADDAGLPDDRAFREVWCDFVEDATAEVAAYSPPGSEVPAGLAMPRWDWDGPISPR